MGIRFLFLGKIAPMNTLIGRKIRILRRQKGWSQEEAAFQLSMSRSAYSRMEAGKTAKWIHHLDQLCDTFEISLEEFLRINKVVSEDEQEQGKSTIHYQQNELAEKLIEQYELRLLEKDQYIKKLEFLLESKSKR